MPETKNLKTLYLQQQAVLNALADGITVQDNKGQLVFANQAAAKIIGFKSVKELLSVPPIKILDNFIMYDEKGAIFPIEKLPGRIAFIEGKPAEAIVQYQRKGKNEISWAYIKAQPLFDENGKVDGAVNLFEDITALKQNEEKLVFQNILLETQFEASQEGILVVSPDGFAISLNNRYAKIWGVNAEQIEGHTEKARVRLLKKLVKDPEMYELTVHSLNRNPRERYTDEIELIDGRWLERYSTPLTSKSGLYYGRIWFTRDITDRKKEMETQKYFLGIASHELKTPLASIKAYVHLANRGLGEGKYEKAQEHLHKIDAQTNHLHKLIKDFLDITLIRSDRLELIKETFDFDEFIDTLISDVKHATHHIIVKKGKTGKKIAADQYRLHEVFANLIRNADKYSPKANKIIVSLDSDKNNVYVSVKDFGIGIPEKMQHKIFELFFRAKQQGKTSIRGFGVGLYISSQIVKKHNGSITVESKIGKGSVFTVSIPIK